MAKTALIHVHGWLYNLTGILSAQITLIWPLMLQVAVYMYMAIKTISICSFCQINKINIPWFLLTYHIEHELQSLHILLLGHEVSLQQDSPHP